MDKIIALCDVNNCFASSEVVFQPELAGKPLIVLSNNDACAIARSKEAKQMGIKMAQPYFQFRDLQKKGLLVRSANFSLYTNLSERIRAVLETLSPSVVPYSIDESFLDLTTLPIIELESYAKTIQQTVLKQTGMPVGVGVAESKTLAKAANWAAKKYPKTGGVVSIAGEVDKRERMLKIMPVGEVWGVGRATTKKLATMGVESALDLAKLDPKEMREQFSIVLSRTIDELNGVEALEWDPDYSLNKQIIASRSLGKRTDDPEVLFAAISNHIARASKKLREQDAVCKSMSVYIRTNVSNSTIKNGQSNRMETVSFVQPTSDNRILLHQAKKVFDIIYRAGYQYAKAGVTLQEILPSSEVQVDLFTEADLNEKSCLEV